MKKLYILLILFFIVSCSDSKNNKAVWIQNTKNQNIYLQVDGLNSSNSHKLAIIQHGLASDMNHNVVQTAKKAFLDANYVVITFDSRYSLGEGNNDVEKVRLRTFENDLKTVAHWAKTQPFYAEPFAISGHSLGGASVIKFAAEYPEKVNILIPVAPVISGELWEESCMESLKDFCVEWKEKGTYIYTDKKNHKKAVIPYEVISDIGNYDALMMAPEIKADVLLIEAQNDILINPADLEKLSERLNNGSLSIIKSADHNFSKSKNQADLYKTITDFLATE